MAKFNVHVSGVLTVPDEQLMDAYGTTDLQEAAAQENDVPFEDVLGMCEITEYVVVPMEPETPDREGS